MNGSENHRPLISVGSFCLGTAIFGAGWVGVWINANGAATGWGLYWPLAVAAPVATIVNVIAIFSPNGSVFEYARALITERQDG
jgi:hypothetical protein